MTDTAADTVLHRKAQAQRKSLGGGHVTASRALGRALSIAADALWALGFATRATFDENLPTDRAMSRLGRDQLLVLLENDDAPAALAAFDREIVTGLTDIQTFGRVTQFPCGERAFTATDAAMTAPLLDAALPRFASMLAGQPEMAHLQGYRFGALVEDAQLASLSLDFERYQVIVFEVNLAQETRMGSVVFLFPEPVVVIEEESSVPGKHAAALKMVPAAMNAVLTRIHLSLDRAQALRPGDVLPLSPRATSSAALTLPCGHIVSRGTLGQMNGFRAIRIGQGDSSLHKPEARPTAEESPKDTPEAADTAVPMVVSSPSDVKGGSFDLALDDIAAGLPDVSESSKR
ncbi:FliM/FliN family flagellar motor switch protein [Marivita sp. XM-24bin2]|jgi:flagellar motor switch protein FliM|uniref:FliM/FliN family flagellar motor switch protein n=1 Tax=unclassified Marivita TaxID=2632480 RepID=UPI000D796E45|nr:FliM/FliN family flagellar motor switch protein [Marivita sp. XM-24bin2]MCR9108790.1 FliM/FliN family flagellar motor C-terminal domain-containing protein [Paracoccaceae bacterium]PWL34213.1 MAG: flagellar motor switch protein FliM [Marivita sp. XM-24bin2]